MLALIFPPLDPVAVSLGPFVIRWYALAYLAGFIAGWRWCMAMAKRFSSSPRPELYDEFLTWAVIGVDFGGGGSAMCFFIMLRIISSIRLRLCKSGMAACRFMAV